MKIRTALFAALLLVSHGVLGQEVEKPVSPEVKKLLCPGHVELLAAAVGSQQIQLDILRQRVSELVFELENSKLSARLYSAVDQQREGLASKLQEALTEAGADPKTCRVSNLISGDILCGASMPVVNLRQSP